MSRTISADMIAESKKSELAPILLAQVGFSSGIVYAWTGYGDLVWNGHTYLGVGTMGSVEAVTDTSDLSAQGMAFTLEGISTSSLSLAIGDAAQGLPAKLWLGALTSAGVLIPSPVLIFSGLTDVPKITESGETAAVTIMCENKLARLATAASRRFTPDDQAIDYPGDRWFDYVAALQDMQIKFG